MVGPHWSEPARSGEDPPLSTPPGAHARATSGGRRARRTDGRGQLPVDGAVLLSGFTGTARRAVRGTLPPDPPRPIHYPPGRLNLETFHNVTFDYILGQRSSEFKFSGRSLGGWRAASPPTPGSPGLARHRERERGRDEPRQGPGVGQDPSLPSRGSWRGRLAHQGR